MTDSRAWSQYLQVTHAPNYSTVANPLRPNRVNKLRDYLRHLACIEFLLSHTEMSSKEIIE